MVLHIFFLITYVFCENVLFLDPTTINVILIIQCIAALYLATRKGTDYVNPLNVMYLSCILSSIGNIVVAGKVGTIENKSNSYMIPQFAGDAASIWVYGCTYMFIGYIIVNKLSLPKISLKISKENSHKLFYYILIISIFVHQIAYVLYSLGSILKLMFLLGGIGILFYARLWASENDKKYRNYALILYAVQTLNALFYSFLREELLLPTLVIYVGYFVGKRNVKYIFTYRIIPLVVIMYIFLSLFGALGKNRANESGNVSFSTVITHELTKEEVAGVSHIYDEPQASGKFIDRSANIAQLTNVVKLVKNHGFYDGEVSAPLVIALIPRFFWPEKPDIIIGQWFAGAIGQGVIGANGHVSNSINLTIPGECYIDFGYTGVAIGCFLFGFFICCLWNSVDFYSSAYNLSGILFGGLLLTKSFGIGADLQIVISYISMYLLFFMLTKIIPHKSN